MVSRRADALGVLSFIRAPQPSAGLPEGVSGERFRFTTAGPILDGRLRARGSEVRVPASLTFGQRGASGAVRPAVAAVAAAGGAWVARRGDLASAQVARRGDQRVGPTEHCGVRPLGPALCGAHRAR